LLSETQTRLMDPDEVIILAPPQHAILAKRIKYFEDPVFKAMMEAQEGHELPYPPMRKQALKTPAETINTADTKTEKKKRKQARRLKVDLTKSAVSSSDPNTLDPNAPVSGNWQDLLNEADSVDLGLD
ncbi:MAG: type VI secretion protein, partial [Rhodobacterales bacterium]